MEVTFGAKYINGATVVKRPNRMPIKVDAAIVELEPKNMGDWYALESFTEECSQNNKKSNYATNICKSFNRMIDENIVDKNLHHYMLTVQQSDFENLDPEKVLGAFMVADKIKLSPKRKQSLGVKTEYVAKIRFLQGLPKNYYENIDREYSRTGQAMTDFVKSEYTDGDIVVHVDKSEIPFYVAQDFEQSLNPSASDMMIHHQKA